MTAIVVEEVRPGVRPAEGGLSGALGGLGGLGGFGAGSWSDADVVILGYD